MKTVPHSTQSVKAGMILGLAVLLFATPGIVSGQACLDMRSTTLMYTTNCSSEPLIDRAFGGQIFIWDEEPYLIENVGNDLKIWLIDTPASPALIDRSYFGVPNVGDSDYDLLNFSVCDDCRWGVANYKGGTILFDLGTASTPNLDDHTYYSGANTVPGAFTFTYDEQQYLIAAGLGDTCGTGGSALAMISGTTATDLNWLQCLEAPAVIAPEIFGGYLVGNYLYLGDSTTRVFVMQIVDDSGSISLEHVTTPFLAYMYKDKGLAVDTDTGLAVVANNAGMSVWDISDPGNPVERGSVAGDIFNRAAIRCQYAWVARKGFKNSEQTFDISDPDNPLPLDQAFWDPSEIWNHPSHQCAEVQGAIFSPDASTLYLARYSTIQLADFAPCGGCDQTESSLIFADGFESGNLSGWSEVVNGTGFGGF